VCQSGRVRRQPRPDGELLNDVRDVKQGMLIYSRTPACPKGAASVVANHLRKTLVAERVRTLTVDGNEISFGKRDFYSILVCDTGVNDQFSITVVCRLSCGS
jgi:hypothetical protein